jgi:hypothetical protein
MRIGCSFIRKIQVCVFYSLAFMIFSGCRKNAVVTKSSPSNFDEVFELFYDKMNSNYCYWDIDKTNFDSLYMAYRPRFHELDLNNQDDQKKSVSYFRAMSSSLIDNHFQISFIGKALKDSAIYPALDRKKKSPNFHNKYDFSLIVRKYLDTGFVTSSYFFQEGNKSALLYAIAGTISHKILYFSCNQFAFGRAIKDNDSGTLSVLQKLDGLLYQNQSSLKGVIIDLRGNGGGDVADLNLIFGRFINQPLTIGTLKYKNGDGKFNFTNSVSNVILPKSARSGKLAWKLVLLTDNYSASLSEAFAAATQALPYGKLIGETTWGATGPVADRAVYGYGGFTIGQFLKVTTAIGQFRSTDGKSHEEIGFKPDKNAPFNIKSFDANMDSQLSTCIDFIASSE